MQGKDKMVRNFKFFHGIISTGRLTAMWTPQEDDYDTDVIRMMSDEINREIDEQILDSLLGEVDNQFTTTNVNVDYLRHYLEIGGNRA